MRPATSSALAAALLVVALVAPATLAAPLTAETLVDLKEVTALALSPAGDRIAYVLRVPRAADDDPGRAWSQLWVVDLAGAARQLTHRKESIGAPAWSPDGAWITFEAKREETSEETQVWALPAAGGEARALTDHASSVAAYRFSPDGKTIAFIAVEAKTEEEQEAEKAGRDAIVDEALRARVLWRLDVESGKTERLLDGPHPWDLAWAPDGQTLVVQASATPRTDDSLVFRRLYAVPAAGGAPRKIADTRGKLGAMAVSPDGATLAWLGAVSENDSIPQSLFVAPLAGGTPHNLTAGWKGSALDLHWLAAQELLLIGVEGERNALYRVNASPAGRKDLRMRPVTWSDAIVGASAYDRSTGLLALTAETPRHPREVYVAEIGKAPRRLTHHNPALDDVTLARQETITWTGADGWTIGGVLTWPLEYTKGTRYPLILQIHGGPEGVSLDGWTSSAGYPVQLLAAEGYFVLQPNYRGSMGRGVDFSKADHDDLGGKEFEDVLAGIDALVERGLVDGARVGTGGWSYGGYFSAWAATRHTERFRASIVAAGLTNWIAFSGTTDIPHEMALVHWDSYWYDEPELHWQRSPLAWIDQARTPTMLVHGLDDARVHPEQSLQLYQALRMKEVPTSLVLYPREPHGLTERAHELDFIQRALDWYERWVKPIE